MPNKADSNAFRQVGIENGSRSVDVHPPPGYRERPSEVPGAVVWTRDFALDAATAVLPDGCMDLLWIDGVLRVAGPDTRAYRPTVGPAVRISGLRFYPGTAPALLGVPAHELRDTRAELADVLTPADARHATDLIARAENPMRGLESVAHWLAAGTDPADPMLAHIVTHLRAGASVAATADLLDLGPRRLHRISLTAFGYGPKTLARILRMQRALALARAGTPLAETAARTGYADQAHLSRDIRDFAGTPISRLLEP
ncbi:helix-turn-helix domain-containing protein [Nocardia sp. NPDC127526]|uniref:helix-turn-helix domain-containing protein n=1 Tax=Nocardia sp. NPDC127526 TaxID=3345393 RepID=UPI00362DCB9C